MTTATTTPGAITGGDQTQAKKREHHASLKDVRDDVTRLGHDVSEVASDAAGTSVEALKTGAAAAAETGKRAAESAKAAHGKMCEYVSAHPTTSVLIAAGVGALIARILPRR